MRSWADVPADRVVRLLGTASEAVATALSSRPDGAPAVVTILARPALSPADAVEAILGELEAIALNLFPAWRLGARGEMASTGQHVGSFLADLAVGVLAGRSPHPTPFAPDIRATGLARVIAASFNRSRLAIVARLNDDYPPAAEPVLVAGCEWLSDRADVDIWLVGPPPTVDRVEPATAGAGHVAAAGRPHHGRKAEQTLERALARCAWAAGRAWNQTCQPYRLVDPVRVDLLWTAEKCVVEIDGPEHRTALRYAADRRRDVQLQLHGYAVLRFTNAQIVYDIDTVLSQIEQLVRGRRSSAVARQA